LSPLEVTIQSHFDPTEIEQMTYDENHNSNLDIDPAMVVLGLGYATSLLVVIGWVASFVI